MTREFSTPMMLQYMEIKKQYPDCFLFFRLGDFYELFLEDAVLGAKLLQITLTARPRGKDGDIPMAGVPYHAAEHYIAKLVQSGHKVAICEQTTPPDKKGIVERQVVRIVTPGTVVSEQALQQKEHNYIVSVAPFFSSSSTATAHSCGVAFADISTGVFLTTQLTAATRKELEQKLLQELVRFHPRECIVSQTAYADPELLGLLQKVPRLNICAFLEWDSVASNAKQYVLSQFGIAHLRSFGIETQKHATVASATLLAYLNHTQQQTVAHITTIESYKPDNSLLLDPSTVLNLELFETIKEGQKTGSLLQVIDQTLTATGGRLLKEWVSKPLKSKTEIEKRLSLVEELLYNRNIRTQLQEALQKMYDIERIVAKIAVGLAIPADLVNLKLSIQEVFTLKTKLKLLHNDYARVLCEQIPQELTVVFEIITKNILETPKNDIHSGGIIQLGVDATLDKLRGALEHGKSWIADFEQQQRDATGINSLKVKYNKIFGYYIEVSNAHIKNVPAHYYRKQTLVNNERFTTPELKEQEDLILHAQEESTQIEEALFLKVIASIVPHISSLQKTAQTVAIIDVLTSFAVLAQKERYTRPEIITSGELSIVGGRHPVVEKVLEELQFVPNDTFLNTTNQQLILLTGPNMAGKSVYMRQTALIVLLAHVGCFVPAQSAKISLTDRIFVRSGAADGIAQGLSTFMVEMTETAYILNHATTKSLVIMDEIGRGTSTYDGISIAWAVAEYLVTGAQRPKTLFATHYHELQQLETSHPEKIKNYQVAIEDDNGVPVFLHTVVAGAASHSFGVAVAKLAGIPQVVTQNAVKHLQKLEKNHAK